MIGAMIAVGAAALTCTPGRGGLQPTAAQQAWVTNTWATAVRRELAKDLALRWNGMAWELDPGRTDVANVAATAYFAQPLLDAGLTLAVSRCDRPLLDEVASYYVAASARLRSFGDLARERGPLRGREHPGDFVGDPSIRTLPWKRTGKGEAAGQSAECLLCMSQFLHPAARLVRLIATLPLGDRNDIERAFVADYASLIARDYALRFAFDAPLDLGLPGGLSHGAVAGWRALIPQPPDRRTLLPSGLLDVHLWLLSEAAEILAAHGASPTLVPLSSSDSSRLREFLGVGMRRLQQSATIRTVAHDSEGRPIQAMDFFEGEFARHRDDAYAGDTSGAFPTIREASRVDSVGWDIGHAIRWPVVLHSLADARPFTGEPFPSDADLAATARELTYRGFSGDWVWPTFRNFMDGTDGWYRVGYAGRGQWGWPPSRDCNAQNPARACLGTGILAAWGLLAGSDPRLARIAGRLIAVASAGDSASMAFRDHYYFRDGPFTFDTPAGATPSLPLFELLADFSPPADEWTTSAGPR